MAMSLPRIFRSSWSLRPTSSRPSSLIEPPTIAPPRGSRPMMDRPVIDFPHPDSPTRPRASPASMVRSTFPTAWTTDLVSWMCVDRSVICRVGAIGGGSWVRSLCSAAGLRGGADAAASAASQPHVERVTQGVSQQVAGHDDHDDAGTDRVDLPPVPVLQVGDPVVEHVAPVERGVV